MMEQGVFGKEQLRKSAREQRLSVVSFGAIIVCYQYYDFSGMNPGNYKMISF